MYVTVQFVTCTTRQRFTATYTPPYHCVWKCPTWYILGKNRERSTDRYCSRWCGYCNSVPKCSRELYHIRQEQPHCKLITAAYDITPSKTNGNYHILTYQMCWLHQSGQERPHCSRPQPSGYSGPYTGLSPIVTLTYALIVFFKSRISYLECWWANAASHVNSINSSYVTQTAKVKQCLDIRLELNARGDDLRTSTAWLNLISPSIRSVWASERKRLAAG